MRRIELSSAALGQPADRFTADINPPLDLGAGAWSIAASQITVWNTWPNVSEQDYNNAGFTFSIDGGVNTYSAQLPQGVYSATTLIEVINSLMNQLTGTEDEEDEENKASSKIVLSINEPTLGFKLYLETGCSIDFSTGPFGAESKLYEILGAESKNYVGPDEIIFPNQANVQNSVDSLQVFCNLADSSLNGQSSNIIASIVPASPPGAIFVYRPVFPEFVPCNNNRITTVAITITDNLGRPVNFQPDGNRANNSTTVTLLLRKDA